MQPQPASECRSFNLSYGWQPESRTQALTISWHGPGTAHSGPAPGPDSEVAANLNSVTSHTVKATVTDATCQWTVTSLAGRRPLLGRQLLSVGSRQPREITGSRGLRDRDRECHGHPGRDRDWQWEP